MTRVKVCGIKTESDGIAAAEAGADFIGLVFAPSPRQVSPALAKKIAAAVKGGGRQTQVVGVFVNIPPSEINRLANACGLDFIQLSGGEPMADCARIERPVIKAFHIGDYLPEALHDIDLATGKKILYLLDAHVHGKYGGTGMQFNWELARGVSSRLPLMLAGGLNPENVAEAIDHVHPWGVDVSSGVETGGVKDMAKVRAFISAVRRTNGREA